LPYPWGGYSYGDYVPTSVYNLIWHTNGDITVDNRVTSYGVGRIDDLKSYDKLTNQKLNSPTKKAYFYPNTAVYSPLAYVPSVIAIKISQVLNFTVGQSMFLARLFGLAFYIVCVAFALRALSTIRFAWLIFAVSLVPMLIFQASIICADVMVNALAIMIVALVMKSLIARRLSKAEMITLSAAVLFLPVIKPTYVFLSFAILLVPKGVLKLYKSDIIYKLGLLTIAGVLLLLWTYATRDVSVAFRLIGTGSRWQYISVSGQTDFLMHHPWSFISVVTRTVLLQDNGYLIGMFGMLGFDFIQVSGLSIVLGIMAILLAVLMSEKVSTTRWQKIIALLIPIAGIGGIFLSFYITFSNVAEPIIEGVQGRYFIPFLLFALAGLAVFVNRFTIDSLKATAARNISNIIVGISIVSLCATAAKFFYIMLG
jgi:uncharacterized membrane protein